MAYTLEAIIGPIDLITAAAGDYPAAIVVPLAQDLALIPMTDELVSAASNDTSAKALDFWKLPQGFDETLRAWSSTGSIAYVESEHFGGVIDERIIAWTQGALALGPLSIEDGEPALPEGSPMSQVLRYLGATSGNNRDEFEALGLDQYRETSHWH